MINKSVVMKLLIDSCPSFQEPWKKHLDFWNGEEAGLYNDLGEFVIHIVESYRKVDTQYFKKVFDVIEQLIIEGDSYVQNAITVGFLEDLQNYSGNTGIKTDEFKEYLRTESLMWWDKINESWVRIGKDKTGFPLE